MPHRELLTEAQRLSLQAPASDERGMVRHYTLSPEDLTLINRRRGDPNRLGFALMLCYLHFPGRILQQDEQPPAALCAFVAEQLGVDAACFGDYAERDQTRREHVLEIETALGLRPVTRAMYRELAALLLPTALATDHGPTLVTILLEELRARRIVCPPLAAIERLAGSVRARAQRQLWRRLADGLTDQQRQSLDQLLEVRVGGGQSTLAWLRQTAYAATTGNFPKLIERLSMVRDLGLEPERATRVHQNYWLKLAREGGQSTVQHLAELEPLRRYATLTALVLELTATLTDEALNMFEHLIGQMFKKSERTHAEQFHASGKSINEKVRLYARVGQALIDARSSGGDVLAAIEAVLPWSKFESHSRPQGKATLSIAGHDRTARVRFSGGRHHQCPRRQRSLVRTATPRHVDQNGNGHGLADPAQAGRLSPAERSGPRVARTGKVGTDFLYAPVAARPGAASS